MSQLDVTPRRRVRTPASSTVARLAALALVGGVFSAALLVRGGLAERVDATESSAGKDASSEFTVQVSGDERTLEFSGPIVIGVTDRMLAVLDAHPGITTVRLTSPGGRVVEARDLADIIRARGLTTVAHGNCASACTVVFMGGRDRLLTPAASIGFHRYRSPDPAQEEAQANMAVDRRIFRSQGVPNWFLDQAFDTPNGGMWRPSLAELKAANVVTGELTVDGQRIGPPGDRASIEADAWQSPVHTALENHAQASGSGTEADFGWVRDRLLDHIGEAADVRDLMGDPDVDHATACSTRPYEQALSLPAPRNAPLLRFLRAGN